MNCPMHIRPIALCLGVAVAPGFALPAHAHPYEVIVLQDAGGVGDSYLFAINDAGQSVGNSATASGQDAVLWSPSGKATVLQDAGRQHDSRPISINDAGWSVGYSLATSAGHRFDAVLWSPSGKAKVLEDAGDRGISF